MSRQDVGTGSCTDCDRSGNNVVSYFLPQMIKQAGITDPNKQLLINAIQPIFSMMGAVYGATLLDKLGRRFMYARYPFIKFIIVSCMLTSVGCSPVLQELCSPIYSSQHSQPSPLNMQASHMA